MVIDKNGDIFETECDVVAIPVNLKGVMGAGLAKFFALRYSHFVPLYRIAIEKQYLRKHVSCLIRHKGDAFLMLPTKDDWKEDSNAEDIRLTLENLKKSWDSLKIKSLALPALGCGCGKLNFDTIKGIIKEVFDDTEYTIELYAPRNISH